MVAISNEKLKIVQDLYYNKQRCMREISEHLSVSVGAVCYFMRRHSLPRRSFSENNKLRFDRKPPSFILKKKLTSRNLELKVTGIMLYWGEGYKGKNSTGIDFANSDPKMVEVFTRFLREICGVNGSRLKAHLFCHANQNPQQLIIFWSKVTGIPPKQFCKPYQRKDYREDKINKMPYGVVHVRYFDKKLLLKMREWIEEYKNKFCVGGGVGLTH